MRFARYVAANNRPKLDSGPRILHTPCAERRIVRDPIFIRVGYFKVRIRTHEFAEHERVSLHDVKGIGKPRMNLLYKYKYSTASRIMANPIDEMVERLSPYEPPFFQDPQKTRQLIEDWREQIRQLWLANTGEPSPPGWS